MGLPIHVDFAPFTSPKDSAGSSLALAAPLILPSDALTAHIHIGRFTRPNDRKQKPEEQGLLFDKGATTLPGELDIAYTEIASHLEAEGGGADVFIEPLVSGVVLRVDVALQQSMDGQNWSLEILLANCMPGGIRTGQIPELTGNRARIKLRCVCPAAPSTPVRIWANEPRARHAVPPILFGK